MGELINFLANLGCCERCILHFLGERSDLLYCEVSELGKLNVDRARQISEENVQDGLDCQETPLANQHKTNEQTEAEKSQEVDGHISKKQKCIVCPSCIGIFQWGCSQEAINILSDAMLSSGHDSDNFSLALSIPTSLSLRIHRIWARLLQKFAHLSLKGREDHLGIMKDTWKNIIGVKLAELTSKEFIHGVYNDFVFNISCTYEKDLEECKIMDNLCSAMFSVRQKQHRKFTSVYSKQAIDTAIKKITDSKLLEAYPDPPTCPSERIQFSELQCQHASIYMAGRYNKYSRDLPQTPWFVDGERKMESSVQELLCQSLNDIVKADEIKFSSSGREDVDVRCLGSGRPFVVEFLNPKHTKLSRSDIISAQKCINQANTLVQLRDLQIVQKKDLSNLKEGEEGKTKTYSALCIARQGYDKTLVAGLTIDDKGLAIAQKTPVRVLHRRPLHVRERYIYSLKATPVDELHFKLELTTQAGTYIKEFVHGDLGRTVPNLRELINAEVDIVALDVENVALDWPPRCSD